MLKTLIKLPHNEVMSRRERELCYNAHVMKNMCFWFLFPWRLAS